MNAITSFAQRYGLPTFCALTIALSFATMLLPVSSDSVPIVMVFVPTVVALSLTALADGWAGVRGLLSKLTQFDQ